MVDSSFCYQFFFVKREVHWVACVVSAPMKEKLKVVALLCSWQFHLGKSTRHISSLHCDIARHQKVGVSGHLHKLLTSFFKRLRWDVSLVWYSQRLSVTQFQYAFLSDTHWHVHTHARVLVQSLFCKWTLLSWFPPWSWISKKKWHLCSRAVDTGVLYPMVPTGPEKSWKVLNLEFSKCRTWKVLKLDSGIHHREHGSWTQVSFFLTNSWSRWESA